MPLTTVVLLALAGLVGAACGGGRPVSTAEAAATVPNRPVVVVTTNILADVTRAIAADRVEVVDVMPRGADPHGFSLSAAETLLVTEADLVVVNGLGLEEGLVDVLAGATAGGVRIVEVGPALSPIPYATGGGLDPHVWTDPVRMVVAVELLAVELRSVVGPESARAVDAASLVYVDRLRALDAEIAGGVQSLAPARRQLVTNHHVLGYFADRYGFEVVGAVIPSGTTLASPSSADLADLATLIRETGVPAIFAETSQPSRLVEVLAAEAGVDVTIAELYSESLGEPGGEAGTYLDMMRHNAFAILEALDPG